MIDQSYIETFLDAAAADYGNFNRNSENAPERVKAFREGLTAEVGRKYIKIVRNDSGQRSVHSFIVNVDNDKKFALGDILMPASWAAPARNKPRGNILGEYQIQWTGPAYL